MSIPAERMVFMANWMRDLNGYWNEELPLRIHSRATSEGGTPEWHGDFAIWLTRTDLNDDRWRRNPVTRVRTTRAMRKLRAKHPREYEVLYRTAILGVPFEDTITWLNDRAERNQKPERYNRESLLLYLLVACEKTHAWW